MGDAEIVKNITKVTKAELITIRVAGIRGNNEVGGKRSAELQC